MEEKPVNDRRFLFDTNTALYFLGNQLAEPLSAGMYGLSVISEIELLAYPTLSSTEERQIRDFLSNIEIIGLRSDVKEETIALRRHNRVKIPDAIIAASAKVWGATLLTNDATLLKLAGVSATSLKLR